MAHHESVPNTSAGHPGNSKFIVVTPPGSIRKGSWGKLLGQPHNIRLTGRRHTTFARAEMRKDVAHF